MIIKIDNNRMNEGALDTAGTMGHEVAHVRQNQGQTRQRETTELQEEYSDTFADSLEDYANFAMYNYTDGKTLASTNNHVGLKPATSVFDPNYDTATQNFENRVDSGEIDFRQLAQQEINHIQTVAKEYAIQKGIGESEAYSKLYDSAMYAVDIDSQSGMAVITDKQSQQGFISMTGHSLSSINEDIAYLQKTSEDKKITDLYYESMNLQNYFTATPEQFYNPSYQLDSTVGLEDTSLIFIPAIRVAPRIINTTAIATTSTIDNVILNTGIRVDNLIKNKVVPKVQDGYYRIANIVLEPTNITRAIGTAEVVNDVLNDSSPIPSTIIGTYSSTIINIYKKIKKQSEEVKSNE